MLQVLLESVTKEGYLCIGDGKRWREAKNVGVWTVGEKDKSIGKSALDSCKSQRSIWCAGGFDNFESKHEPGAADVANGWRGNASKGFPEPAALGANLFGGFGKSVNV